MVNASVMRAPMTGIHFGNPPPLSKRRLGVKKVRCEWGCPLNKGKGYQMHAKVAVRRAVNDKVVHSTDGRKVCQATHLQRWDTTIEPKEGRHLLDDVESCPQSAPICYTRTRKVKGSHHKFRLSDA